MRSGRTVVDSGNDTISTVASHLPSDVYASANLAWVKVPRTYWIPHGRDNWTVSKRWVALFTCLVTRAIHMEVMNKMSAVTFIQAFRCISRRLRPHGNPLSRNLYPRAPWQEGVYERMIGVVKEPYRKQKNLTGESEFTTMITETEFLLCTTKANQWLIDIIKGEGPRNSWKMGRVERMIEEKDSHCRSVVVKMSNGIRLTRAVRICSFRDLKI
ncbi:hypothetical protein DINM_003484 [Dirofilaria immitis]|nr:hypothetical protein [Dirofilaria immitis]